MAFVDTAFYLNDLSSFRGTLYPAHPTKVILHTLEAEADEMWSFVEKKANKQWIWIAMDAKTRQIIAFHVGDRSRESAKALWANIPPLLLDSRVF